MLRTLMFTRQCNLVPNSSQWMFPHTFEKLVRDYWKHHQVGFELGLRELAALFTEAGIPAEAIGCCRPLMWPMWPSFGWGANVTLPYFAQHPQLLAQALELEPPDISTNDWLWKYQRAKRHQAAFDVVRMFPQLPERFAEACWDVALGNSKTERPWAQKALQNVPDKLERI